MKIETSDMPRFVVEDVPDGIVTLSKDQSHHLSRVLRLKTGDPVIVIDGRGTFARGEVSQPHGKHAQVIIQSKEVFPSLSRIGIAFALPKPQALDFVVRRCTEVGVFGLQPVITDHSSPKRNWNEDRWHRIVEEVSKQCQRTHFPTLHEPIGLEEFLKGSEPVMVCDELQRSGRPSALTEGRVWGLVGPEGGWSVTERESFQQAGVSFFGLGPCRLRVETACLVAATLLMESAGDL